jgi:hypothetical protein
MRANREDLTLPPERPRTYLLLVAAAAVVVLAIPLYFVLQDPDEQSTEAPVPMPVVRDSAIVAPPVVDPAAQQQAVPTGATGDFTQRQLNPDVPTVGAGTATVVERARDNRLVIDGPLLEEIESDAAAGANASTADQ